MDDGVHSTDMLLVHYRPKHPRRSECLQITLVPVGKGGMHVRGNILFHNWISNHKTNQNTPEGHSVRHQSIQKPNESSDATMVRLK